MPSRTESAYLEQANTLVDEVLDSAEWLPAEPESGHQLRERAFSVDAGRRIYDVRQVRRINAKAASLNVLQVFLKGGIELNAAWDPDGGVQRKVVEAAGFLASAKDFSRPLDEQPRG
jgi:hypothetical protein